MNMGKAAEHNEITPKMAKYAAKMSTEVVWDIHIGWKVGV